MPSRFIFVVCQKGAEAVCKNELFSNHPELKFAFSRPGFLTFKCDGDSLPEKFNLKSTFARTYGWSLGNHNADEIEQQLEPLLRMEILHQAKHLHIWQRDSALPGSKGFEPGPTILAQQIGEEIATALQAKRKQTLVVNRNAKSDELVFDIVLVEPDNWWFGYHHASSKFQRWPGGTPKVDLEHEVVNRAYFKLQEALLWSGIRINKDDVCAEIGSSPGGACQLLLEKGARVLAIDPAELDPEIAKHENLVHLRGRSREIRKKEFKDVRWLLSDINATPSYTLDTLEEIVNNQSVARIRGLILTMKITDWKLAEKIPDWVARVKQLGFQVVKTRQLAFNRREICLFAARDAFALRSSKRK